MATIYAYAIFNKGDEAEANEWLAKLSPLDGKELYEMLTDLDPENEEDGMTADWIEDHGGRRRWLNILCVGDPVPVSTLMTGGLSRAVIQEAEDRRRRNVEHMDVLPDEAAQ